jgi:anaerobic magnesium-protoporphyrin IX monomethyl ester cyclase
VYGYHFLAPFPGTTVREELDKYDLKILTEDWSRYDANSPVVCTSGVSPDQMTAFVKEFEAILDEQWQEVVERYARKECTPHEELLVEGNRRMKLIYKLLSEDIIEGCAVEGRSEDLVKDVSKRIAALVGEEYPFVSWTLKTLVDAGYIKAESMNGSSLLFWTHNLKLDRLAGQPSG